MECLQFLTCTSQYVWYMDGQCVLLYIFSTRALCLADITLYKEKCNRTINSNMTSHLGLHS